VTRAAFLALLLTLGIAALAMLPSHDGEAALTVMDVGQGDSLLVQDGGIGVMIDTGLPGSGAGEQARKVVPQVPLLVLTHLEKDHAGDAPRLISTLGLRAVVWSGRADASLYDQIAAAARKRGIPLVAAVPGDVLRVGRTRLTVLGPDSAYNTSENHNDSSLVLRADFPGFSAILTGDLTVEAEKSLDARLLRADVLKVGHHGSKTSTGDAFLAAVSPSLAVVSVGAGNRYGHPSPEVLERLGGAGIPLLRTDLEGAIRVSAPGGTLRVSTSSVR